MKTMRTAALGLILVAAAAGPALGQAGVDELYQRLVDSTAGRTLFGICQSLCSEGAREAEMSLEVCYDRCYVQILAPIWFGPGVEPAVEGAPIKLPDRVVPGARPTQPAAEPPRPSVVEHVTQPQCRSILEYETEEVLVKDKFELKAVGRITNTSDYFSVADAGVRVNLDTETGTLISYERVQAERPSTPIGPGESRSVLIDIDVRHYAMFYSFDVRIENNCRILVPRND